MPVRGFTRPPGGNALHDLRLASSKLRIGALWVGAMSSGIPGVNLAIAWGEASPLPPKGETNNSSGTGQTANLEALSSVLLEAMVK